MCGIAGYFDPAGFSAPAADVIARHSLSKLSHRGPDDEGVWLDEAAGVILGHRRLAVLDLSSAGHQPMVSASGRFVIALNGEIFNHLEIREELRRQQPAPDWRGHSDTETLLAAIDAWGIEASLNRCVGMFAFALWDRADRTLTIARDRLGEKPLYYGWQGTVLLFGSELKALRAHPSFVGEIDRNVLASYLTRGYIEAPSSIYKNIFKLLPGTFMQFSAEGRPSMLPEPIAYWSMQQVVENGATRRFSGTDDEAISALEERLRTAVSLQSVADVPLGAFLSGGFDSTTVVALMQEQAAHQVKTFTIGFHEKAYNEANHAKVVAQHLGTDHTELYVSAREAIDLIPTLPTLYDEPFGDSSAIPMALVSKLARERVTVALSGDGGDELFGGYSRYKRSADLWRRTRRLPAIARSVAILGIRATAPLIGSTNMGLRAGRLQRYMSADNPADCYQQHIAQRHDTQELGARERSAAQGLRRTRIYAR